MGCLTFAWSRGQAVPREVCSFFTPLFRFFFWFAHKIHFADGTIISIRREERCWSTVEEETLIKAHEQYGNRWALIANFYLEGIALCSFFFFLCFGVGCSCWASVADTCLAAWHRTDNAIKNHWNSTIRRRLGQSANGSRVRRSYPSASAVTSPRSPRSPLSGSLLADDDSDSANSDSDSQSLNVPAGALTPLSSAASGAAALLAAANALPSVPLSPRSSVPPMSPEQAASVLAHGLPQTPVLKRPYIVVGGGGGVGGGGSGSSCMMHGTPHKVGAHGLKCSRRRGRHPRPLQSRFAFCVYVAFALLLF